MVNITPEKRKRTLDSSAEFLLEEYRNIAATHDRMRDAINRMFYYFLLLSAIPFTVASIVFQQTEFAIHKLPTSIGWLFTIISAGILFLSLASASARWRQNQYAKTVNLIRAYFADHDTGIAAYLLLPKTSELPQTRRLGHVFWYLLSMALIGGLYACFGAFAVFGYGFWTGLGSFLIYIAVFALLLLGIYKADFGKAANRATNVKPNKSNEI